MLGLIILAVVFPVAAVFVRIRIDLLVLVSLDTECRALDIEIAPWGRKKWKRSYRAETPPGELMPLLLKSLSQKRQQYRTPAWIEQLPAAQKLDLIRRIVPVARRASSHVHIKSIDWKSVYGAEDAMQTALRVGAFWAAKGMTVSLLSSLCRLEGLELGVEPDFVGERLWSRFAGIFQIRLVHIIIVGAQITVLMVRGYWNGRSARQSVKSSHRGVNENCYAEY